MDERPGSEEHIEVSTAKYFAAEVAVRAANTAVKIFGSYGFSTEYPVERFYRDAKSYQIVEGTSNIQKMILARNALGQNKEHRREEEEEKWQLR